VANETKRNPNSVRQKTSFDFRFFALFFFCLFHALCFLFVFCSQLNWATFEILVGSLQKEPPEMLNL